MNFYFISASDVPLTRWKRSSSRFFFVLENHSTPQIFFLPLDLKYFLQNGKSANSKNPSVRRFEDFFHSFGYLVDSKSFCLKIFVQASAAATIGCCCPCCKVKITPRWFRNSKIPNFSVFVWLKVCFNLFFLLDVGKVLLQFTSSIDLDM